MCDAQGPIRASHTGHAVHRVRHTVLMRLSLPCMRKDTTGHGGPSTRGRRLQPATAGAPAASGAGGQAAPQSVDRSARWLIRRRHRAAPALCGAANPLAGLCGWRPWLAHELSPRYCLSAQRSADRSVRRLIPRRRRTAPASHWAARPHSCPPGRDKSTPLDAAPLSLPPPPRGHKRKAPALLRSARATYACHPPSPS
jgi:hypothetical protein